MDSRPEGAHGTNAVTAGVPAAAVLLAAGRGSRLAPLTDRMHKSLLPVAGKPVLQHALDAVVDRNVPDIVVVVGDKAEAVARFVRDQYGNRVTTVLNERFAEDTNILSAQVGVSALRSPASGYLIVETDVVVSPRAWDAILDAGDGRGSFWVTRGFFGKDLTGGALQADASGRVTRIVYAPSYDPAYEGWHKLVGVVYVGRDQVAADRDLRARGVRRTISQYYMMPWVEHLELLPCRARPLGDAFAASFNDPRQYLETSRAFEAVLAAQGTGR